jgi:hypothetical protein
MGEPIDEEMKARIAAAKKSSSGEASDSAQAFDDEKVRSVDELRAILKKFRRAMGSAGSPGVLPAQGPPANRTGWIIASGKVKGYGDEIFHVFLLTSGPIYYLSGDATPPVALTGKWFLGESIPALEAKIPGTIAQIMAEHDLQWPETSTFGA